MGLTVKLTRRRSETFAPPISVSVLHWIQWYFFVSIFIFEYISGRIPPDFWDTLTLSTCRMEIWPDLPGLKGQWLQKQSVRLPFFSFVSFTHSSANVSCVIIFFFYFFLLLFILYSVFLLQVNICFFLFFSVWKMNGFVESADDKRAASVTWTPPLLFSNRRGRWPLNVETRCWGRRCGLHFQEEFFGLWG